MQILCPRNEIIKILDVWENSINACPAYNNTHQSNTSYVHYNCDGKHSCTIPTHYGYGILSVYFYCRVSEGNALTDKEKKPFPGGVVAGGIAGGIIILFVTFGVLLYRRKHIDCLQSKRNVPYESSTVRETNDRHYTSIELSPDTKHDKSADEQFMGNTRQMYENAAHIMQAHARETYYNQPNYSYNETPYQLFSSSGKCITIANDTTGIIKCGPSQHIHMENIWLGNNNCLSQRTGVYVYKDAIQNITCQNVSICTVPFVSGIHKYLNIHYQCTGCLSVPPNNQRVISCPEHTTINVHDVWSSMKHGCPAYNQIHKIYIRNFKIHCEGGVDCTIYNSHSYTILSLYFHCEEITKGNALTDKEKKPFPGGAVAGGIAGGIIILFVTFGVLLYRYYYKSCICNNDDCTFINHGAFWRCSQTSHGNSTEVAGSHRERQPLRFFDRELIPHLVYISRRLAKFVGCDPSDLVLVTNATTAINTVVKGTSLQKGDTVYMLSTTYGAVKKLLKWQCELTGAVLQEETVTLPVTGNQQIVDLVRKSLKKGTKLAVFDHIPSNTPFILPIKELVDICREKNVPVLIDGAHGLHDYSPFLALHTVIDFWDSVGPSKIRQYMYGLCKKACNLLLKKWETSLAAPEEMFGCMALVEIPPDVYRNTTKIEYSNAESLQNQLYHQFNIEVPIKCVDGVLYVRISCHIYNDLSDYEKLGEAVLRIKNGQSDSKKQKLNCE
ncbi:unnamed protein product [Mytilus edulis]|uniref:Aminotransferase class V domain-containing protein n=1 Tax=Mytilus edulis TaxID=6550 RepID=A0A8S3T624_MYTED|nr:unnamed protein product [Mytilus edulis]